MPGSPLFDLGDLLRSSAATVGEDDPDAAAVDVKWECAEAILEGFLETAGSILTDDERRLAPGAGWLLAGEQAIRYLTDYLSGDRYYGSEYPGQNLDRARNQFALARASSAAAGRLPASEHRVEELLRLDPRVLEALADIVHRARERVGGALQLVLVGLVASEKSCAMSSSSASLWGYSPASTRS